MSNTSKIEIDIDEIIKNLEESFSMSLPRKPILSIRNYDAGKYAGASNDGSTIFLNSIYFYTENGKYYTNSSNIDLLKMRLTHELVHIFSNNFGKSGICSNDKNSKYVLNNRVGKGYLLDYNEALNEGITQMFTDETLDSTTRSKRILDAFGNGKNVIVVSNHINAGGSDISNYEGLNLKKYVL